MLLAIILMTSFQPRDVKNIGNCPVSRGVPSECICTDGFGDANWAANWPLRVSAIDIC